MNEERRYLFTHFTTVLGHSQLEVLVKHNYTNWIQGNWGLHFLSCPLMVQWTCGYPNIDILTNDTIEHFTLWSDYGTHEPLLQLGVLLRPTTLIQCMNSQLVYFPNLSFLSYPLRKKITLLSVYRYKCHFFLSFLDNQNMNYVT